MAHAAPASGAATRPGPGRLPDVFSARTHTIVRWGLPAVSALIYGYWAAANVRYGNAITGWNLLLGFVTAIVFFAVCMGALALARRLPRELHAVMWGALTGIAVGFLYSLSGVGHAIVWSTLLGLVTGAATGIVLFYRYYTREDAQGRRIR